MLQRIMFDPVTLPDEPPSDLDALIDFFTSRYPQRKQEIVHLLDSAKQLRAKQDIITLGFEVLLFRGELDEWNSFAAQALSSFEGHQLSVAHDERAAEAQGRGSKRPDATLVKAQASQFSAPVKRAKEEIQQTRDWLDKILSWCQSQQKNLVTEEIGELFAANQNIPDSAEQSAEQVTHPPSLAQALKRAKSS